MSYRQRMLCSMMKKQGTYETITDLWMRTGAGKEKTGIIVVPAGKKYIVMVITMKRQNRSNGFM